ncbi:MAG: peptidoglycan editing factor PgeF [Ktedonobacteraceae bacterium]
MIAREQQGIHYLQFDHYRQFPELIHGVFTRTGGDSEAPYASLNTSRMGDSIEHVARNRQHTLDALNISAYPSVTLWQVHGADVLTLDLREEWRTDWASRSYFERSWTPQSVRKGDALLTRERGTAVAFSFADCVPITLYDPVQHVIGIAHGGWRGTARGIALATVEAMGTRFGSRARDIYAGIGPAIGPCCYEISQAVQDIFTGQAAFPEQLADYQPMIRESAIFSTKQLPDRTSLRIDLQATNRQQLAMAGVPVAQIEFMDLCTGCNTDLFFSHRKEQGNTGRFAVIMTLAREGAA